MEAKATPKTVIFSFLLITIILICSCSVQSRKLASSPSPTPMGMEEPTEKLFTGRNNGKVMKRGSMPGSCHGRCNECTPCLPVEVSVRAVQMEEYEYYPQVWKCMCNHNIFSPSFGLV